MRHSRCLPAPKACARTPRSRAFMPAHQSDAWRSRLARREGVLSCPCAPGAGAAVASMGWQSRLPSAVAVETRPAMLGQGAASQAFAILQSTIAAASIGRGTGCNAAARPDCGLLHVFLAALGRLVGEMRVELEGRTEEGEEAAMEAQCNQDRCVLLLCDFRSCERIQNRRNSKALAHPSPLPLSRGGRGGGVYIRNTQASSRGRGEAFCV
jgi:hypothetical protein